MGVMPRPPATALPFSDRQRKELLRLAVVPAPPSVPCPFHPYTRKRIRRGTFGSVRELVQAIQDYIRENNKNPRPFRWVASANVILRKVRKYKRTLETGD